MDLGKTVLPQNEINGSWIKIWDPKKNLYFNALLLLCLEWHLRATVLRHRSVQMKPINLSFSITTHIHCGSTHVFTEDFLYH